MAFEARQPHGGASEHVTQPGEGRGATCERSIAFVLALDEAAAQRVEEAVATAVAAKAAGVFVLAAPRFEDQVAQSVYSARRKGGRTMVRVLGYDPTVTLDAACAMAEFELSGMSQSLTPTIRVVAESMLEDYDAAIVLDAAEQVTADRLREMCLDPQSQPDPGIVGAWTRGLRHPSYLTSRALLEQLQ